jgi:hypothetical protein
MASKPTRRLCRSCWPLAAIAALAGCGREEPLRVYVTEAAPRPQVLEIPSTWRPVPRLVGDPADVKHKFEAGSGADKLQINISTPGGGLLANVNRWRRQLFLHDVAEGYLMSLLKPLDIDEYHGYWIELVGPETQPEVIPDNVPPMARNKPYVREALYGAIVPAKGLQWFFRLKGPVAAAEKEKANFRAFVESGLRQIAAATHEPKPETKSTDPKVTE